MNRRLLDAFQAIKLPEILEDSLDCGIARCIAFNRRGTLLAAGCEDGQVVLWDFETRSVARKYHPHRSAVTSVAWSHDGRRIATTSADGTIVLWNVSTDQQEGTMGLNDACAVGVSISQREPRLCLVSFLSTAPVSLDFRDEIIHLVPCVTAEGEAKSARLSTSGQAESLALLSHSGEHIYLGQARGTLAVLDRSTLRFLDVVKIQGSPRVLSMSMSRKGQHLLVNCQDKVIRLYEVVPPGSTDRKSYSLPDLRPHLAAAQAQKEGSILNKDAPLLRLSGTFQNAVERNSWVCAAFSGDTEHVAAASSAKAAHALHIWDRWQGKLDRILTGPKEGVVCVMWHPLRPLIAVVSTTGRIYLWARLLKESWSAFTPDFEELQENQEYVEREDEFDINPRPDEEAANGAVEAAAAQEQLGDVDILTIDEVATLSSDDEDKLTHLPVVIEPQEFDEKGALVVKKDEVDSDSPAPSELTPSEMGAEGGVDSAMQGMQADGKHRLAVSSLDEDIGARHRSLKPKRYQSDDDEDMLIG